jgi:hypothetical protein
MLIVAEFDSANNLIRTHLWFCNYFHPVQCCSTRTEHIGCTSKRTIEVHQMFLLACGSMDFFGGSFYACWCGCTVKAYHNSPSYPTPQSCHTMSYDGHCCYPRLCFTFTAVVGPPYNSEYYYPYFILLMYWFLPTINRYRF